MIDIYLKQIKRGRPLTGGLRKRCFLIDQSVYCLWSEKSLTKNRIIRTIKLENRLAKAGFPVRQWQKLEKSWIKKIRFEKKVYWLGIGNYLSGKPAKKWTKNKLFNSGLLLAELHQETKTGNQSLLHLDFARANLLFGEKNQITGILDFEEAQYGQVEKDLACSLSFLVIDNPHLPENFIFKHFLNGYQQESAVLDYDKIRQYYISFLKMRQKEGNQQAFILLAKKRLEVYKKEISAKILNRQDLKKYSLKNKNKKIVFTIGAFELLHWGHLEYLKKLKDQGDLLVVGVVSDDSRRRLKGEPYPLITERTRAETLAYFPFIDGVVIIDEENLLQELKALHPKTFGTVVKDWQIGLRKADEEKLLKTWGGKVIKAEYFSPAISSSQLVEKIAFKKTNQILNQKAPKASLLGFTGHKKIIKEVKFSQLKKLEKQIHQKGKTIAFTSLTADLFHLGHARFIQKAKSLADILVVGVPSNKSVRALKGSGRPIIDEKARALVLANLPTVDYVVIFDERTILGCLKKLKPEIFFTVKEDWNHGLATSPEAVYMKSIGGKIVCSERQAPFLSASKIIDKAAGELIQKKFAELIKVAKETSVLDADNGFDPHSPQAQLAAREKGFYEKVLQTVAERRKCVFCDLKDKYLIAEKNGLVLTVALFPYIDGHLLIIPRRHLELARDLKPIEQKAVFYLLTLGNQILKKKLGVENVWFILREGRGIEAGKTVAHLHFHLIPYDPRVVKMGETELSVTPQDMAKKLREK